jgi:hypothetical protein
MSQLNEQQNIQLRLQALELISRRPQTTGTDGTVLPIAQYVFDAEDLFQFMVKDWKDNGGTV